MRYGEILFSSVQSSGNRIVSDQIPSAPSQAACVPIDSMHPINVFTENLHHLPWWTWAIFILSPVIYVGQVILKDATKQAAKPAIDKLTSILVAARTYFAKLFRGKSSSNNSNNITPNGSTVNQAPISWLGAFMYSYILYAICTIMIWNLQRSVQVAIAAYAALPIMTFAVKALQRKWFSRIFSKDGVLEKILFVDMVFLFLCFFMLFSLLITRYLFLYPVGEVLVLLHGK